jgi:hypothetical protein
VEITPSFAFLQEGKAVISAANRQACREVKYFMGMFITRGVLNKKSNWGPQLKS